jgi:hypothetical protein
MVMQKNHGVNEKSVTFFEKSENRGFTSVHT